MTALVALKFNFQCFIYHTWVLFRSLRIVFRFNFSEAIKAGRRHHGSDDVLDLNSSSAKSIVGNIERNVDCHETAAALHELIHKDGAGSWPPRAQFDLTAWPAAIRPYKQIYLEIAHLIPQAEPSLDDAANEARIYRFRELFRNMLSKRINLDQVKALLAAADEGRWDIFPRDVYNAFYCCIASSRHAYRWASNPVVKVVQREKQLNLPEELVVPWQSLQRHFGCASESGNNTSNIILNFDTNGKFIFRSNTGMVDTIYQAEENFSRIFRELETHGLPVYHDMMLAIVSWTRQDKASAAHHVSRIEAQIRAVLNTYYEGLHDGRIAKRVWLSRIQGFFGWGLGYEDENGNWVKYDGLSGNQVLLFHALDAFLGLSPYLEERDRMRNVPALQRRVREAFEKYSFRSQLSPSSLDPYEVQIVSDIDKIVKKLRLFRTAHRTRSKSYLSVPAPERMPMTAGKSLLKDDPESSLDLLDSFMIGRLRETE